MCICFNPEFVWEVLRLSVELFAIFVSLWTVRKDLQKTRNERRLSVITSLYSDMLSAADFVVQSYRQYDENRKQYPDHDFGPIWEKLQRETLPFVVKMQSKMSAVELYFGKDKVFMNMIENFEDSFSTLVNQLNNPSSPSLSTHLFEHYKMAKETLATKVHIEFEKLA